MNIGRAVTQKNELNEEAVKLLTTQYENWMKHPTTVQFIDLLNKRAQDYDKALIEHIRSSSDKEFEDKHRSAIQTVQAILRMVTDPGLFIQYSTKQQ